MSKIIEEVTIGADPEVLLENTDRKLVSAVGKIGGSKENPMPLGDGFAVLEDNVTAEFNIPPSKTCEEFMLNVKTGLNHIRDIAALSNLKVSRQTSGVYDDDQLRDEAAHQFGCEADLNAYTLDFNVAPDANQNLRSAGGHIHIGYKDPHEIINVRLVKMLDLLLGVPVSLRDPDKRRRQLYGKAGAFRHKPYGVEYRVLSNWWVHTPERREFVYKATQSAIEGVNRRLTISEFLEETVIKGLDGRIRLSPTLTEAISRQYGELAHAYA